MARIQSKTIEPFKKESNKSNTNWLKGVASALLVVVVLGGINLFRGVEDPEVRQALSIIVTIAAVIAIILEFIIHKKKSEK